MHLLPLLLSATVITNVGDLVSALRSKRENEAFSVVGTVATRPAAASRTFILVDEANCAQFFSRPDKEIEIGDLVRVTGRTKAKKGRDYTAVYAHCERFERLGRRQPPLPRPASPSVLKQGSLDYQFVSIRGTVSECFADEIAPGYIYVVLACGSETIFATTGSGAIAPSRLQGLVGAEVSVCGIYSPHAGGARKLTHRMLLTIIGENAFTVHRKAPSNRFDTPLLDPKRIQNATDVLMLGQRRLSGRVIAVWRADNILISGQDGMLHRIKLNGVPPPQFGEDIDAVGRVETDLYTINLSHAVWRKSTSAHTTPSETPQPTSLSHLLVDEKGRNAIITKLYGKTIRISGEVQDILPSPENGRTILLQDDGHLISVDFSANHGSIPPVRIGSRIEVTGIYIVETETWHPHAAFPHATGVTLVVRKPDDIRVLAQPPFLTPARLITAIGILLAIITVILIWNISLRHIAKHRSRELLKEEIAHISTKLRLDERTRLAVELHDSVLQNLTSAALQLDIARRTSIADARAAEAHFNIVSKTIQSSHEELRNCVWDLRSQMLEEHDIESAIRQILRPRIGSTQLVVRFNVSRNRISDNTAYALFRIIRELGSNAVRHGKATVIKVVGAIERDVLLISVSDNGCGFDPENRPGIAEGHFGLQGITERVRHLNGRLEIRSAPGQGTRVRIELETHTPTMKKECSV